VIIASQVGWPDVLRAVSSARKKELVSSLPGGAASKLGDRYKGWWTLLQLADVLKDKAATLCLKPPAAEGTGIEFWVDEAEMRWCEQAKDAQQNWTVQRLITSGVLLSVAGHLEAGTACGS
jgi:hypothetical protein